jgi:hypothetical protein
MTGLRARSRFLLGGDGRLETVLRDRALLRRRLVLAELLGPPLALRPPRDVAPPATPEER